MPTLTIGKYRSLQQCANQRGALVILAMDHRGNLRELLAPSNKDQVPAEDLMAFKREVIAALSPIASAVLVDPEYGAAQCIASGALPGGKGLVVAVEASGYTGNPLARQSRVLEGWGVDKTRRMGASAVKLLAYYHPDAPTAPEIEALVQRVAHDCQEQDIALMLEPLSYSPDPSQKKLPPSERRRVVLETARRLTFPGVDVLKAEFPLDIQAEPDERQWAQACAELTAASRAPWVLLSASVSFETFLRQVALACQEGASGVAVGRAVWQEAVKGSGLARQEFLEKVARPRMERIEALCTALARPWVEVYQPVETGLDWYTNY